MSPSGKGKAGRACGFKSKIRVRLALGCWLPAVPRTLPGLRLGEAITRIDTGQGATNANDTAGLARLAETLRPGEHVAF